MSNESGQSEGNNLSGFTMTEGWVGDYGDTGEK